MTVPFNKLFITGKEVDYIAKAVAGGHLSGNGPFTKRCEKWLEDHLGYRKALLTHSCTAALEMASLLMNIKPGDEVIMPSYTFVSTATAFVLRGAVPVFVDVRQDTFNLDEALIEAAITKRTKVIVPVHYAGVACEMDAIMGIAIKHDLLVVEDNAQGIMSSYKGRYLGTVGHLAAISFHETKNITCGEGGALIINDSRFKERAEVISEKGTNRNRFLRGEIDKYTWMDIGSSYLPSEIEAAFLMAQLDNSSMIQERRLHLWNLYHAGFRDLELEGSLRRPVVPDECRHNAHMYYILLPDFHVRTALLDFLKEKSIQAASHYIPLHTSEAGKKFGIISGSLEVTEAVGQKLLRLPLHAGLSDEEIEFVTDSVKSFFA